MRPSRPNFIVGIGGSAGALNAYKKLLGALPPNTGMAFVIVSHMTPNSQSQLAEILARHTKMPVTAVDEAMPVLANSVYVLFPNADVLLEGYHFKVVSPRTARNKQVDIFLISLAVNMGARAIGVILSGYDGDGTEGCKLIKEKGGITFAQDFSAEVDGMPASAQAAGCIDFVLPPEGIARELVRIASVPVNSPNRK